MTELNSFFNEFFVVVTVDTVVHELILYLVVYAIYDFLCCAKAFKFNSVPFVYFWFCFHYPWRWITKDLAAIYIKECFTYVFL